MVRRALPLLAAAVAAGAAGAASAAGPATSLTVAASSHAAGAKRVRLTVTLAYEMQCGYPGAAPAVLVLPQTVPQTIEPADVLVDGKPATSVSVRRDALTVGMPPRPQILCDSITLGRLRIVVTAAAGLANPTRPGAKVLGVRKGAFDGTVRFVVTGR